MIQRYTKSWEILRDYDRGELRSPSRPLRAPSRSLDLAAARTTISSFRKHMVGKGEHPGLFGQEVGDSLASILLNVEQVFGSELLYPTVESRAAHLLYFLIKDHPLVDGNQRIGTMLFLE